MIESILSFNFSDKKIFPDTKERYIFLCARDTLGERKAGPTRYRVIGISISRKNGKKGGGCTRFEKRLRYWTDEKWLDVTRKREERRPPPTVEGHRSSRNSPRDFTLVITFFPPPSLAFLPDFLPPVIAIRTKKGKRKDRNYIYYCFAINGGRVRVRFFEKGGIKKKKDVEMKRDEGSS